MQRTIVIGAVALLLGAGPAVAEDGKEHAGHGHQRDGQDKHHGHNKHHGHKRHRFKDPQKWLAVFEKPERDKWQKPDKVVARLKLASGMKVAAIGAGTGYFAVRIARKVPRGKVFAVDLEASMVRFLTRRAAKLKLPQLVGVLARPDDPAIPEPVDRIFLCNTYHHIDRRSAYFRRVSKMLRPGGLLVVVDYKMGKIPQGPPPSMRVPPKELDRELSSAGYRKVKLDLDLLLYQYLAIYRRGS